MTSTLAQLAVLTGAHLPGPDVPFRLVESRSAPSRIRAVLVDDHTELADACRRLLAPVCEVVAAVATGEAALAAVRDHRPDLLILDVALPGLTGLQVAERLRPQPDAPRIVILTLDRSRAVADCAFGHGVLGFVTKARMVRDLVPAVKAALAGKRFCSPLADAASR